MNSLNLYSTELVRAYLPDIELPMPMPDSLSILVFHPASDSDELISWLSELTLRPDEVKGIMFYSIIYPGRKIQLLPPKNRFKVLKEETQNALNEYERTAADEALFRAMKVAYIGDWEKKYYRTFDLDTKSTSVILFDSNAQEVARYLRFSKASVLSLRTALFKLRQTSLTTIDPMDFSEF